MRTYNHILDVKTTDWNNDAINITLTIPERAQGHSHEFEEICERADDHFLNCETVTQLSILKYVYPLLIKVYEPFNVSRRFAVFITSSGITVKANLKEPVVTVIDAYNYPVRRTKMDLT